MIWPEDGDADADAAADLRALQRRQEEYARALDRQIAARRAAQAEEQRAREELERRLRPSARSPAKWLADGGRVDDGNPWPAASPQLQQQQQQTGEPSPFTRFRVTDESQASERQRERAQQLEWRRLLDAQVRENARLRAAQEEQRRRGEREAADEEVRFLRDQQLRAQRKLGYTSPDPAGRMQFQSAPSPEHDESLSAGDTAALLRASARRRFQISDSETRDHRGEIGGGGGGGGGGGALPPAAPTRLHGKASFSDTGVEERRHRRQSAGGEDLEAQQPSRLDVIEQYRGLLSEIRREREELRREREEARREKEELRIQRALLELENEKMASLVDAQRRLAEQQMERQQRDAYAFAQQQQQQQQQQVELALGDFGAPTPPRFAEYSRADQLRQSLAALNVAEAGRPATPRRRVSPMSMAEFAAPRRRQTQYAADSPVYDQRQAAAAVIQRLPVAWANEVAEDEAPLDQSLVGESVFVPLEPAPLIPATTSPRGQRADPRSPLRNSRVIRSRGFYDIESVAEPPASSRVLGARFPRLAALLKGQEEDEEERKYGRDEPSYSQEDGEEDEDESSFDVGRAGGELERFQFNEDGSWASISDFGEDELRGLGDGAADGRAQRAGRRSGASQQEEEEEKEMGDSKRRSPAASGLFQVQVLV